jgi:hypothetical protein
MELSRSIANSNGLILAVRIISPNSGRCQEERSEFCCVSVGCSRLGVLGTRRGGRLISAAREAPPMIYNCTKSRSLSKGGSSWPVKVARGRLNVQPYPITVASTGGKVYARATLRLTCGSQPSYAVFSSSCLLRVYSISRLK